MEINGEKAVLLAAELLPFLKLKVEHAERIMSFWRIHESWGVTSGAKAPWEYVDSALAIKEALAILNQKGR